MARSEWGPCQGPSAPSPAAQPWAALAGLQHMAGSKLPVPAEMQLGLSPHLSSSTELSSDGQTPRYLTSESGFVLVTDGFQASLSPGNFSPEGHPVLCGRNPPLLLFKKLSSALLHVPTFPVIQQATKILRLVLKIHLFWLFTDNCHGTFCSSAPTSPWPVPDPPS